VDLSGAPSGGTIALVSMATTTTATVTIGERARWPVRTPDQTRVTLHDHAETGDDGRGNSSVFGG